MQNDPPLLCCRSGKTEHSVKRSKRAHDPCIYILHEYYTPKALKIQAVLSIFTFFVNYADFYVNIIMLTPSTKAQKKFAIFNYLARYCGCQSTAYTKYSL